MTTLSFSPIDLATNQKRPLLNQASLSINKGLVYALIGKNGSGKSTLIHYCKDHFSNEQSCRIRVVPQNIQSHSILNVEDTLRAFLHYEQQPMSSATLMQAMIAFQLDDKRLQSLSTLSSGELQRVFLLQALLLDSDLLLLDETFSNLDLHYKLEFTEWLKLRANGVRFGTNAHDNHHNAQQPIAIVLIEHDLAFALAHFEHVILLDDEKKQLIHYNQAIREQREALILDISRCFQLEIEEKPCLTFQLRPTPYNAR